VTVTGGDAALDRITRIVAAETGLCFRSDRADTEAAIRRAMNRAQLTDLQEFAALLEAGHLPKDDLVSELTVGESYFFREPQQFDFIRNVVFPDVLARRGAAHTLRIWSAGCASGEEAYSLAIGLIDAGLPGHVLATDLSHEALQRARAAVYRPWSLRGLDEYVIRRCFHRTGSLWTLDERFRVPVTFEFHNLARGVYPSVPAGIWGMDLILCRNVLIYLDPVTIRRVAVGLSETLADEGWLITGPSDPPLSGLAPLRAVATPHGIVYRKQAPGTAATSVHGVSDVTVSSRPCAGPVLIASGPPRSRPTSDSPAQRARDSRSEAHSGSDARDRSAEARAALAARDYGRVLGLTQRVSDETTAVLRVRAIANRDGAEDALAELDRVVKRFPLATELHLLRAILRLELNQCADAIQSVRRTLYLDRSLVVAHFLLATALRRQGRLDAARRAYRNARDLAMARRPDEPLPLADGERAGAIAEIASAELALLDPRQVDAS
jgi:chemotaxis protein methyltransferase CheR